jgi:DUF971 family protein
MEIFPTQITARKQAGELIVGWNDGHESRYPLALLRYACPCAMCRGGHENMRSDPDPEVFTRELEDTPATRLKNLEAVGSYAVTMEWEDGHNFGIYNWRYLRALCPCPECEIERAAKDA